MRKKISAAIIGSGAACLLLVPTGSAGSHGYTDAPTSRQVLCAQGTVQDCGEIQWEPQSVEGPKGFPSRGPADGTLCAGGNSRFAELDDPRGGNWPATTVTGGQSYSFRWKLTARHATTDFRYYLTNGHYDPTRPLTRSDLEPQPFLTVPYNGRVPDATVTHQGKLPAGRTGKQLILAVWTIADTGNAFYACSDVRF
ncbi:lytic polysaccharide monooxygenase [Streptomyces sp. SCA3-4]|uniref:lytic polysaccharide monooxygenase auxiliary activity family 9 protein n=1 Tax=Streptomyces sichuanensis TaxID=2871810 RepID=UPI001CE2D8E8|nr:lytic polysaccharide monooxygenase auxiliary activity family 9 protein [Streptomyces sichuanensis]MCA6095595.1 lytic polysaccharide monooxygenase [Streptomyces sichuanensis]